jgi:hypothetical protein
LFLRAGVAVLFFPFVSHCIPSLFFSFLLAGAGGRGVCRGVEEFPCVGVVSGEVLVKELWLAVIKVVALLDVYGAEVVASGVAVGPAVSTIVLVGVVVF